MRLQQTCGLRPSGAAAEDAGDPEPALTATVDMPAAGHDALATDGGIVAMGDEFLLGDAPEASPGLGTLSTQSTIQYAQPQAHTKDETRDCFFRHPFDLVSNNSYDSGPSASALVNKAIVVGSFRRVWAGWA